MWWLSFNGGATVIVRADTLVHARLLAAVDEVARRQAADDFVVATHIRRSHRAEVAVDQHERNPPRLDALE